MSIVHVLYTHITVLYALLFIHLVEAIFIKTEPDVHVICNVVATKSGNLGKIPNETESAF